MEIIRVNDIREATQQVLINNPNVSKYRLAKDLNLSTSTHINNFLSGATKRTRVEVLEALYTKYNILVKDYEDSPEYRGRLSDEEGVRL